MSSRHEEYRKYYEKNKDKLREKHKEYSKSYREKKKAERTEDDVKAERETDRVAYSSRRATTVRNALYEKSKSCSAFWSPFYAKLATLNNLASVTPKHLEWLLACDGLETKTGGSPTEITHC
jgi:hypothetical protein